MKNYYPKTWTCLHKEIKERNWMMVGRGKKIDTPFSMFFSIFETYYIHK